MIANDREYVAALREVSWLWKSHEPGAVERVDALIEQIEAYEANPKDSIAPGHIGDFDE